MGSVTPSLTFDLAQLKSQQLLRQVQMTIPTDEPAAIIPPGSSLGLPDSLPQSAKEPEKFRLTLENGFESLLKWSRFVVLLAVVASIAVSFALFWEVTADTALHLTAINGYSSQKSPEDHEASQVEVTVHVVESIDGYLLAAVMLIFAFGLYEIFINPIDSFDREARSRLLTIHSLDDLKEKLGRVVLLILIVKFFKIAVRISPSNPSVSTAVIFSAGVLLIAVALYVTQDRHTSH
jgi:uncharacterized membrane protein YqhA